MQNNNYLQSSIDTLSVRNNDVTMTSPNTTAVRNSVRRAGERDAKVKRKLQEVLHEHFMESKQFRMSGREEEMKKLRERKPLSDISNKMPHCGCTGGGSGGGGGGGGGRGDGGGSGGRPRSWLVDNMDGNIVFSNCVFNF